MPFQQIDPTTALPITGGSQPGPSSSGWLSLSALRTELALRLGGRTDIDSARLNQWINEAYIDICGALDLAVLRGSIELTLTVEAELYVLPSSVRMARTISFNDPSDVTYGQMIRKTDEDEYRRLPILDGTGLPSHWVPFSPDLIVIYPAPDQAYVLAMEVKYRPGRMTSDAHYPILKEEMVEGLLLLSRAKAFSGLLEFGMAGQCQNEYTAFMRSRRDEVAEQSEGMVGQLVPVRSRRQLLTSTRGIREWHTREL